MPRPVGETRRQIKRAAIRQLDKEERQQEKAK
jgi:hypothetical protein